MGRSKATANDAVGAKPKGKMTAYAYFAQQCREDQRKKRPGDTLNFAEFSKRCGERWKQMSDHEKEMYQQMARQDKARYEAQLNQYKAAGDNSQGKGKKRKRSKKDPNAPKRALSAFFWYCSEERPKVRGIYPSYTVGQIAKELGQRWAAVPPSIKAKYEAQAAKDKSRYEHESKMFKANGAAGVAKKPQMGAPAQAVPQNASEEDDYDDDDDEDDEDDEE